MRCVSVVIPTLFYDQAIFEYANVLSSYGKVKEVIIVINDIDAGQISRDTPHRQPTVREIFIGTNKGFTGASNAGACEAKGKYLLFLNDDCHISPLDLTKMVSLLEQSQDLKATQPIVKKENGDAIENIGFLLDPKIGKATAITQISKAEEAIHPKNKSDVTRNKIYGLSATCLLIDRKEFQMLGMFDESFHSYLEDVDLSLKMRKFGTKFAPCLQAFATHTHMATSKKMGIYAPIMTICNWWRLILKHPKIFLHYSTLLPMLIERGRNLSGAIKSTLSR
jgi:GT2 family glycosyltransferase